MFVFLIPSILDLAGTIVDTAGLFYVKSPLISDQCVGKPDAERLCNIFHLPDHLILP